MVVKTGHSVNALMFNYMEVIGRDFPLLVLFHMPQHLRVEIFNCNPLLRTKRGTVDGMTMASS